MEDLAKNIAEGLVERIDLETDFYVLKTTNQRIENQTIRAEVDRTFVQFHFCIKGNGEFVFPPNGYRMPISEEQSLLLYNTQKDLPLELIVTPKSTIISIVVSIKNFHALFSKEANFIHFLREDNTQKKFYSNEAISPASMVVLSQINQYSMHGALKELYTKGKVYELMSLYFNTSEEADMDHCPFLVDEENVVKIKKAKEIIMARMAEPPTLSELAMEVGLSLKKLKAGFKQIYGDSVFHFLFDYKMEYARRMLETGKYNVNEVGLKVGYSTASHFIAAFKKKYGTTPKKYSSSQLN
ncbi:MAG: AraC family transcriptional regulator [Flavobacteriaceae bacterium]|nr:AraC family transcriptional regulator [Flavobacteriaceae bacterium]